MSRRRILGLALVALAALALAVAPWTVSTGRLTAAVARQLRSVYGLDLTVNGRATVAFLPVPRLKFEDISLGMPGSPPLVEAAQLRGDFRLWPLLIGQVELAELALNEAKVRLDGADGASLWSPVWARQRDRIEGRRPANRHIRRLIVTNSTVALSGKDGGDDARLDVLSLVMNWPAADGSVDVTTAARWRGEAVQLSMAGLQPAALASGAKDRFAVEASTASTRLSIEAEASLAEGLRATGRTVFSTKSLRDLLHWTDVQIPFGGLVQGAALSGDFTVENGAVSFPAVQLTLGSDKLDGALSGRLDGGRLSLTGTLAADRLNLAETPAPFGPLQGSGGAWSYEPLDLRETAGADLDLRISAAAARLGPLRLDDLAANLLVRRGRVEISLGRATLNRGTVKGRLAFAAGQTAHDLKLLGSFDRIDIGALLADLGHTRWISGTAQGQVNLEAAGESAADLVRRSNGRGAITVRQGDLWGVAFADALRRSERRPLSAPLEWKGGRTPFEQAQAVLNVHGGIADVVDAQLVGTAARAALQGLVSLPDKSLALKATVEGLAPASPSPSPNPNPGPSLVFDIYGAWSDVSIVPDARTLIQRSGAARQLLGAEPRGEEAAPRAQ
ncbi:MAG TPA: AsmA family protein [Beijerinckiaceae bacterium]|jgi:AsmA protein